MVNRDSTDWDRPGVCEKCGYRTATVSMAACPECGGPVVSAPVKRARSKVGFLSIPAMLYQRAYKWFVYLSVFDVLLTWFIVLLGGSEVNVLADAVIATAGLKGILIYKFCLVILVIVSCEVIGRRRPLLGRRVAHWSIAVTAIPVVLSILQLLIA